MEKNPHMCKDSDSSAGRFIQLLCGMTGEFLVIQTNAPDDVITTQLVDTNKMLEKGTQPSDEFELIYESGY